MYKTHLISSFAFLGRLGVLVRRGVCISQLQLPHRLGLASLSIATLSTIPSRACLLSSSFNSQSATYSTLSENRNMSETNLPILPVPHEELASYIAKSPSTHIEKLIEPYRKYETELRYLYAQSRDHEVLNDPHINVLPLFTKDTQNIKTRARNLATESPEEKEKYIMPLPDDKRRTDGSPAVVQTLKEFRHNFGVFCESSLIDLDWDNVVAAGSSVVNCLLPVPEQYTKSKRALRQYCEHLTIHIKPNS